MYEVSTSVAQDYRTLQEVSLFLMQPTDPSAALGLYISVGGTEWQYRGFVSNSHPSGTSLSYQIAHAACAQLVLEVNVKPRPGRRGDAASVAPLVGARGVDSISPDRHFNRVTR